MAAKITRAEMTGKNYQIAKRCITQKPNGTESPVSIPHISRIFNPDHPHTPSPGLARKMAAALTDILERPITTDDVYDYLEQELGKDLGWPKNKKSQASVPEEEEALYV